MLCFDHFCCINLESLTTFTSRSPAILIYAESIRCHKMDSELFLRSPHKGIFISTNPPLALHSTFSLLTQKFQSSRIGKVNSRSSALRSFPRATHLMHFIERISRNPPIPLLSGGQQCLQGDPLMQPLKKITGTLWQIKGTQEVCKPTTQEER